MQEDGKKYTSKREWSINASDHYESFVGRSRSNQLLRYNDGIGRFVFWCGSGHESLAHTHAEEL